MTSTLARAADHVPIRTCVVCRRRRDKTHLLRMARMDEGVRPDPTQRLPGRGAYVCPDDICMERLRQRGGQPLERAFPGVRDDEVRAVIESLEAALATHETSKRSRTSDEHQRSNA